VGSLLAPIERDARLQSLDRGQSLTAVSQDSPAEPFLRWAGGKRQILDELLRRLPADIDARTYREPFLGGGALFFALRPNRAILSDANPHLIKCYEFVRDKWGTVADYLRAHAARDCESHYYSVRAEYNEAGFSAAQAARFIYLNKTCFNGVFRVNLKGRFNVPYGRKQSPAIPKRNELQKIALALRSSVLETKSFESVLRSAVRTDFFYLDPPYPPLNDTAFFTHYTTGRFNSIDQKWLADRVRKIDERGCPFMMTNADIGKIRRLYQGFRFSRLPVTRYITCKSKRDVVRELVITNY
jgi:DNA adenine methylase